MAIEIGQRPADLHGCWQTWTEKDVDVVLRTPMESGAIHTRRRFTGIMRMVQATVTLPRDKYDSFMTWFRVYQKQGSIPTYVITPTGDEEVFQFAQPPTINWVDRNAFTATVELFKMSYFEQ